MPDKWVSCISDTFAQSVTLTLTAVNVEVGFGNKLLTEEDLVMGRPNIGDTVMVDFGGDDGRLSGVVVEGPWLSNGDVQGKPTWKVDPDDGFAN